MFGQILKLSRLFYKDAFIKQATVLSDMAIRVMHSLVPYTTDNPAEARHIMSNLTSSHLINVAERYVKRIAEIVLHELEYSTRQGVEQKSQYDYNHKDYSSVLRMGQIDFIKVYDEGFGGESWKKLCDYALLLTEAIEGFKKAKQQNNQKDMDENSGLISAYMNVIDGLSHNTGSFISKMISKETTPDNFTEYYNQIINMMDSKQLSNKEDVIPIIKQFIMNNPDAYLYKEYLSKLDRQARGNFERAEKELIDIRDRKRIIEFVSKNYYWLYEQIKLGKLDSDFLKILVNIPNDYRWKRIKNKLEPIVDKYLPKENKIIRERGEFSAISYDSISPRAQEALKEMVNLINEEYALGLPDLR